MFYKSIVFSNPIRALTSAVHFLILFFQFFTLTLMADIHKMSLNETIIDQGGSAMTSSTLQKPQNLKILFKDPQYAFQFLRAISVAPTGAADIAECFITGSSITEGNDESWFTEWSQLAQRIENEARQSQSQGHNESARTAFFRATNYYRTAEFFLHKNTKDPRILTTWRKSRDCFREGIKYANQPSHQDHSNPL